MQNLPPRASSHRLTFSPEICFLVSFFGAGICLAEPLGFFSETLLPPALFVLAAVLSLFLYWQQQRRYKYISYIFLGILFSLTGFLLAAQYLSKPTTPDHISNVINSPGEVTLSGVLAEHPAITSSAEGIKSRFMMKVDSIYLVGSGRDRDISGKILLTMNGALPADLKPGDTFLARTKVSPVRSFSTPGTFDYVKHLAFRSVYVKGWVSSPHNILKVHEEKRLTPETLLKVLYYLPERIRNEIALFINRVIPQPSRGLYKAILIGSRSDIPPRVMENFISAGCVHLLAISGLHMGFLGLVCFYSASWLLKRSTWIMLHLNVTKASLFISLIPLVFYALVAGLNIPVLRALLMTLVFITATMLNRPGNLINHILIAAFLVLAWKPTAIFTVSFQLSFSAIFAISFILPALCSQLNRIHQGPLHGFKSDGRSSDAEDSGRISRWRLIILKWILTGIVLSAAAMAGTLPLLLFHFNRVSLVSPLANLVIEPIICSWALVTGLIGTVFIPLIPVVAEFLFIAGSGGLLLADKICILLSSLPYASIRLPTPTLYEIALYYIFIGALASAMYIKPHRRRLLLSLSMFSLVSLLAATAIPAIRRYSATSTAVSVLDVGHGSTALLQLPHNMNILIDGGGSGSDTFNIGERVIAPFLWKNKINRLDKIIITHPHADHYNGLDFILIHFLPEELWINGVESADRQYRDLLDLAGRLKVNIRIPATGQTLVRSGNSVLQCVANSYALPIGPDFPLPCSRTGSFPNINDTSLVLRLDVAEKSFLFPADISGDFASILADDNRNIQADVLLAPHHGSRSSISRNFIDAVSPGHIIVSAGCNNRYNLPDKTYMKLQNNGITVFTTCGDGTVTFDVMGGKIEVSRHQAN